MNAGTTLIDPGVIQVSGSTTLADWRYGGDTTLIDGGEIAANTITANKITIGVRGVTLENIEFEHNNPNVNQVSWTAGKITYVNDGNSVVSVAITAGEGTWSSNVLYVYWVKGAAELLTTTNNVTAFGSNNIVLATYQGGSNLVSTYGRTVIDGSNIKTGTITAAQADILSLQAGILIADSISSDMLQAGSVTASKMYIGNTSNLINDSDMVDEAAWTFYLSDIGQQVGKIWDGFTGSAGCISLTPTVAVSQQYTLWWSQLIPVTAGEQYYCGCEVSKLHTQTTYTFFTIDNHDSTGYRVGHIDIWGTRNDALATKTTHTVSTTIPTGCRYISIRAWAYVLPKDVRTDFGGAFIRKKNDGTLVVDGSITATKLSVTSLSAISANLGTIKNCRLHVVEQRQDGDRSQQRSYHNGGLTW